MTILPEVLAQWEAVGYNKAAVTELYVQFHNAMKAFAQLQNSECLYIIPPMHPNQMLARMQINRNITKCGVYRKSK